MDTLVDRVARLALAVFSPNQGSQTAMTRTAGANKRNILIAAIGALILGRVIALRRAAWSLCFAFGAVNLISYVAPQLINQLRKPQNLKIKYQAQWAVVTGASSGLGAAIVDRLAAQDINVVMVALEDDYMRNTHEAMVKKYPRLQFRAVGVNMADSELCLNRVADATSDIDVQLLFNNAGYVYLEAFHKADMRKMQANMEVLVQCPVKLTDHFYKKWTAKKQRGAISFTSSQGAFFPSPLSTVYSGGKAFIQAYAQALGIEANDHGIDVLSLQPGYMRSNFTKDLPRLSLWNYLDMIGQSPDEVAERIFSSLGNMTLLDSGIFSWGSRLLTKVVDLNVIIAGTKMFAGRAGDYKKITA